MKNIFLFRNFIELAHILAILELPLLHRDPFDRLMIAQVQQKKLPILTADAAFDGYDIQRLK